MKTIKPFVLVIIVISSIFACKTDDRYKFAVSKGIEFLVNTNDRYKHDTVSLLGLIYNKTGKEEVKDIYERERARLLTKQDPLNILFDEDWYNRDSIEKYLRKGLYRTRKSPNGQPIFSTRAMDDIVIRALYCKYFPFTAEVFDFMVENIRDHGGYFSTHTLYALHLLRQNGCCDINEIDKIMLEIANEIEKAQLSDKSFSDLYAERTMLLLYCGYKKKVRESWINKITKSQNKDGSWSMYGTGGRGRVHPTVLSMAAILLYSGD